MTFYFSAYSTPLLLGFIQGWIYAILLWLRGRREERLSDKLLGWVLVALSFEIWIYLLGFGGIHIFWQQLEFFPRTLSFLLPPLVYFYLKSQFDARFRFQARDAWHALPFVLDALYRLLVFSQGSAFVRHWKTTVHDVWVDDLTFVLGLAQQLLYLYWSFHLYRAYRTWTTTQFSNLEIVSFRWFRNFLLALTATLVFNVCLTGLDRWLNLTYWQNWWGDLVTVVLIYYVSIEGYAQRQPTRLFRFRAEAVLPESESKTVVSSLTLSDQRVEFEVAPVRPASGKTSTLPPDLLEPLSKLLAYMEAESPFLDPDLSLTDLARLVHLNPGLLSQLINTGTGRNFNDFINEYRVKAFKRVVNDPANSHLSLLGMALDCGFNSKATFNRSFRKFTGVSPRDYLSSQPEVSRHQAPGQQT
ncbi:helix-turn-helix domain-containing protein [Spirosoma gilvum]